MSLERSLEESLSMFAAELEGQIQMAETIESDVSGKHTRIEQHNSGVKLTTLLQLHFRFKKMLKRHGIDSKQRTEGV